MPVQDQPLKFEDLLQTVQESERGRWFLSEFESRLRKSETAQIFSAIQKLEAVMAEQGKAGADTVLVARARTAIAAARREIAALEGAPQLSDEGRLFAKLADMARSTFAAGEASAPVNAGIDRALRLVDQIEQDLSPFAKVDGGNSYFPAESGVFEPPQRQPAATVIPSFKAAAKEIERGARLLIRKTGEVEATLGKPASEGTEQIAAPVAQAVETPADPVATVASITPPPLKAPRVVIIRRKPEELLDVPMVDESAASSAA